MAGAGYKLFATGDVLTAAQVNTFLMEQAVMRFADSAARNTALSGVLAEGMVSYLQDTNSLEVYDGSDWVGATGDITALTAGTGINITSNTGPIPTVAIDTAVTADLTTAQTLTNKTLTTPVISSITNTGTLTLPTSTDTIVGRATTDTLTNKTLTSPVVSLALNAQTATYTAVLGDASKIVTMSVATANDFLIPTNANVAFPIGTVINVVQIGAGKTTIKAVTSGTTTISSTASVDPDLRAQFSAASCIKTATDAWLVLGDIS
jgi:hypothetical protein